jgi:hypothetical protein
VTGVFPAIVTVLEQIVCGPPAAEVVGGGVIVTTVVPTPDVQPFVVTVTL